MRCLPHFAHFPAAVPLSPVARGNPCQQMRERLVYGGGSASGLFVIDAESGKPVCARAAKRPRILASNTKLFTTSTALSRFGPEYRIATKLLTDGKLDAAGVLHGSLYLQGGGDPALGVPSFYDRYGGGLGTNLLLLAAQLRVDGRAGRYRAALRRRQRLRPAARGRRLGLRDEPLHRPPLGTLVRLRLQRLDLPGLRFRPGDACRREAGWSTPLCRHQDPHRGRPRHHAAGAEALGAVRSPTMSQLVEATDVYSNNFFAEMLAKLLGAHFGGAGTTQAGTKWSNASPAARARGSRR